MQIKYIPVIKYFDITNSSVAFWINLYLSAKENSDKEVFYLLIDLTNTNLYGLTSQCMEELYFKLTGGNDITLSELSDYVEKKFKDYDLPIKGKFFIDILGVL